MLTEKKGKNFKNLKMTKVSLRDKCISHFIHSDKRGEGQRLESIPKGKVAGGGGEVNTIQMHKNRNPLEKGRAYAGMDRAITPLKQNKDAAA
ncbi:hypothetical protein NPIL_478501 [Nephila pilipes]|uniref:Uncharacterized protein n=1 Tax=Nephila pilipes TaxID=299642 RepID=A0A8X6ICI5_NEPPI|nr:hypothetical protein NPIL_478501 [Nephila pilipes]